MKPVTARLLSSTFKLSQSQISVSHLRVQWNSLTPLIPPKPLWASGEDSGFSPAFAAVCKIECSTGPPTCLGRGSKNTGGGRSQHLGFGGVRGHQPQRGVRESVVPFVTSQRDSVQQTVCFIPRLLKRWVDFSFSLVATLKE